MAKKAAARAVQGASFRARLMGVPKRRLRRPTKSKQGFVGGHIRINERGEVFTPQESRPSGSASGTEPGE